MLNGFDIVGKYNVVLLEISSYYVFLLYLIDMFCLNVSFLSVGVFRFSTLKSILLLIFALFSY